LARVLPGRALRVALLGAVVSGSLCALISVLIVLLPEVRAGAQSSEVTNQDVLDMTKAGLSANVIADKISSTPCRFDTSIAALASLKSAGVDDDVLSAMIRCHPPAAPHDKPYVWIGANEEWIAHSKSTSSITKATVQTHSEYADATRGLSERCRDVIITNSPSDADYAVTIERYNAGHFLTQRNRFSVFRARDGNLVLSNTTTLLKNAATDICKAISHDTVPK
jgi:hypothetical protein